MNTRCIYRCCAHCDGTGAAPFSFGAFELDTGRCPVCLGTGHVRGAEPESEFDSDLAGFLSQVRSERALHVEL